MDRFCEMKRRMRVRVRILTAAFKVVLIDRYLRWVGVLMLLAVFAIGVGLAKRFEAWYVNTQLQVDDSALASQLERAIASGRKPDDRGTGFGHPSPRELLAKIAADGNLSPSDCRRKLSILHQIAVAVSAAEKRRGPVETGRRYIGVLTPELISLRRRYLFGVLTASRIPDRVFAGTLPEGSPFFMSIPQFSFFNFRPERFATERSSETEAIRSVLRGAS